MLLVCFLPPICREQGQVYHMVIRYKSEEDIRAELGTYDWDQLEGLDLDDDDKPEGVNAKFKLDMLLAVAGLEDKDPDDVEKPKSPEEVCICDGVREKLETRFELVAGRGRKLLDDRLYVRKRLWEIMNDQTMAYLLQECVVYIPADALEGLELIDAPGTGVVSPQEQRALQDVLETADAVVVCMQRNLQDCKDVKPAIQKCLQFQKYIEDPKASPCKIFFFSAIDEKSNFTPLDTPKSVSDLEKRKSDIKKKNTKGLKQMVKKAIEEMKDEGRLQGKQDEQVCDACLQGLEENMYSSYPLLWASVSMGPGLEAPGEQLSAGRDQSTPRARKEELLNDVTRMLSALRGRSTAERQIMQAFFDKVAELMLHS